MIRETDADRSNEDGVAEKLARSWNCEQRKLTHLSHIDRHLYRDGDLVAHVEIKCRNNTHDKYDEYFVDAMKLGNGLWVSHYEGVPFFLVVRFTDGIYWIRVDKDVVSNQKKGGRKDRGDPNDIELCCYIKHQRFTKLAEVGEHQQGTEGGRDTLRTAA